MIEPVPDEPYAEWDRDHGVPGLVLLPPREDWRTLVDEYTDRLVHRLRSGRYVFVSYVRDDSDEVARLLEALNKRGVPFWRDKDRLRPGERWRFKISEAIQEGHAFLAIFSAQSENRARSYMREELIEAVEELRLRSTNRAWFFPVLLSKCELPALRIGGGETLRDLHYLALYESWDDHVEKLAIALKRCIHSIT